MLIFAINDAQLRYLVPRNDIIFSLYSSVEFHIGINKVYKQRRLVLKNSLERWFDHWSTLSLVIRVFSTRSTTIFLLLLLLPFSLSFSSPPSSPFSSSILSVRTLVFEKIIRDGTTCTWKVLERGGDKGSIRFWVTAAVSAGLH